MSEIKIGQAWKNHLGVELTITEPGYLRLSVLSDDIWIAESKASVFGGQAYVVTAKSLADAGYKLIVEDQV